jgi:hypothetical protein
MARLSSAARAADRDDLEVDYSERAGFLTGKAAAIAEWSHRKEVKAFAKVVEVLRVTKWRKEKPDLAREIMRRQCEREKIARRLLRDPTVLTCLHCGAQWCRVSRRFWPYGPTFCTAEHGRSYRYEQQRQDPQWVARNRARVAAWQRRRKDGER